MRKPLLLLSFIITNLISAQSISSSKWRDLFAFNNVRVIKEAGDRIIAATENGLFYYYPKSGEIKKLSKANGLHQVKISAFDYNENTEIGLVGYADGSLDVITPDGVHLIIDIPLARGYSGSKSINHISIHGNRAIISVGYGISVLDLVKREFGDTCFFSKYGTFEASKEAVLIDKTIYAATASGLKSHELNVTFPVYTDWKTLVNGSFTQLSTANDQLLLSNKTTVYYGLPASLRPMTSPFKNIKDIKLDRKNIIVAEEQQASVFCLDGQLQYSQPYSEGLNTAMLYNGSIFLGTPSEGLIDSQNNKIKPDGPYNNSSYRIKLVDDQIWVASGRRGQYYEFYTSNLGYYHFNGIEWVYPDYFKKNPDRYLFNILDIAVNPSDTKEVFFTNALQARKEKGIFKMIDHEFAKLYNEEQRSYIRIPINLGFDEKNNLYATNQYAVLDGGRGKNIFISYYNRNTDQFEDIPQIIAQGVEDLLIKDGIMYINSSQQDNGGMILYRYQQTSRSGDDKVKILRSENNLPLSGTVSCALDNYDDLWIGDINGLRILDNPEEAIDEEQPQTQPISISQSGIGEELFRDNKILSIAVDSGNQKWISVADGGVFYLSADGMITFEHFTKANSPLPTDQVTDIKINNKTGEVFFATSDGIVAYKGDVANVTSEFNNVTVYPNPVITAQYKGPVKIKGLALKTNIRITDAAGHLVHQAVARGGYHEWNLQNGRGKRVASGIYFLLLTNADGTDTATAKIAVVN